MRIGSTNRFAHCKENILGRFEMGDRNFKGMLENQWSRDNFVCVGLDSEFGKIPECLRAEAAMSAT